MSTIVQDLNTLQDARDDMKTALENKGMTVTNDIRTYANAIANIPSGSGSGDVKLFDTVEHMQADPNPSEGDLAVVYREELTAVTIESEFDSCTFSNEVVLDEAFTGDIYGSFRAVDSSSGYFDGMVEMSSSSFRFDGYGESSEIRVEYESEDGITYTRTDGGDNPVEFGATIRFESWGDPFPSVLSNFMKIGGNYFEGLYEYKTSVSEYILTDTQLDATSDFVYQKTFYGKNGVENGILTTNVSNSFADINAEVYAQIQEQYDNMQPRILTDQDKTIDTNIKIIPVKSDGTPLLDTSNVTNMNFIFAECHNLTTVSNFNTSNVTNMVDMFYDCTNLISVPNFNTSNVTQMSSMFHNCINLISVPNFNTSNVTQMGSMFNCCYKLTTVPNFNTSNVTQMGGMFNCCYKLTIVPQFNTSKVTSMGGMFYVCTNLINVPNFNTFNVTNMVDMFQGCNNLTNVPNFNTSKVTYMYSMFNRCSNLTNVPEFDTSNVTNMSSMFNGCTLLTTMPLLDTSNVTDMGIIFAGCTSLSNESLNNILAMCKNATKITSNKTLKYIGLTSTQATTCQGLSNYSAFTAAGWTTGY